MTNNYKESENFVSGDYVFVCEGEINGNCVMGMSKVKINDIVCDKKDGTTQMIKHIEEMLRTISKKEECKTSARKRFRKSEKHITSLHE